GWRTPDTPASPPRRGTLPLKPQDFPPHPEPDGQSPLPWQALRLLPRREHNPQRTSAAPRSALEPNETCARQYLHNDHKQKPDVLLQPAHKRQTGRSEERRVGKECRSRGWRNRGKRKRVGERGGRCQW